jgi:hypothetical protein
MMVAVLAATPATPQESSQTQPSDSAGYTLADIAMIGTAPIPLTSLNSFLINKSADTLLSSDMFEENLNVGAALRVDIGRWMADAEFTQSQAYGYVTNARVELTYWSLQVNSGYRAFELGRFRLTPYLGFGARFNTLNISRTKPGEFASFIGDSSLNDFELSNRTLHAELGAGIDYVMPFTESPFAYTDLLFGLRLGYTQGLSDNGWRHEGRELSGGPEMIHSGLAAWLTIGWQLRQRKPDSQTVATYREERELQEQQRGAKWRFGIIGGPFWSTFYAKEPPNSRPYISVAEGDLRNAATFGAMASYRVQGTVSLHANLLYSMKGADIYDLTHSWGRINDSTNQSLPLDSMYDLRTRFTADYIELPILGSVGIEFGRVAALRLITGFYGAILVNSWAETERRLMFSDHTTFSQGTPDLAPFDVGGVLGLGFDIITRGPIFTAEFRLSVGFSDIGITELAPHYRTAAALLGCWF